MTSYRVNNIGFRLEYDTLHIVKYYKNEYFGNYDKMIEDGWEETSNGLRRGLVTVTDSCFKNPDSCYTVAILETDKYGYTTNLRTLGDRVLDLNKKDRNDFFKVYEKAHKYLLKQINQHNQ